MDEGDWLAERFEENRPHMRAVAYRMLGSLAEAEDDVQEAWLRLSRSEASGIENLGGWLTTVVARVCLNMLQSRRSRREEPLDVHVPDPLVSLGGGARPRTASATCRLGRPRPVGGPGNARSRRAAGVRAARHVRCPFDEIACGGQKLRSPL